VRKLLLGALASALTLSAVSVTTADAQPGYYHRHSYYHHRSCYRDKRRAGNQGTALGAVSGGVLGGVIGHGLVGGLVGAGVGAVAGHAIAKSTVHC
jgi:uncharacterized protein YcfJ